MIQIITNLSVNFVIFALLIAIFKKKKNFLLVNRNRTYLATILIILFVILGGTLALGVSGFLISTFRGDKKDDENENQNKQNAINKEKKQIIINVDNKYNEIDDKKKIDKNNKQNDKLKQIKLSDLLRNASDIYQRYTETNAIEYQGNGIHQGNNNGGENNNNIANNGQQNNNNNTGVNNNLQNNNDTNINNNDDNDEEHSNKGNDDVNNNIDNENNNNINANNENNNNNNINNENNNINQNAEDVNKKKQDDLLDLSVSNFKNYWNNKSEYGTIYSIKRLASAKESYKNILDTLDNSLRARTPNCVKIKNKNNKQQGFVHNNDQNVNKK